MVAGGPVAAQPLETWLRPFTATLGEATWRRALVLVAGAILSPGRRTIASALRAAGLGHAPGFANFHRVLSEARWSGLALAEQLLALLVAAFAAGDGGGRAQRHAGAPLGPADPGARDLPRPGALLARALREGQRPPVALGHADWASPLGVKG